MLNNNFLKILSVLMFSSTSFAALDDLQTVKYSSSKYELSFMDAGDPSSEEKTLGAFFIIAGDSPKEFFLICGDYSVDSIPLRRTMRCAIYPQEGSFFMYFNSENRVTVFNLNLVHRNSDIPDEVTEVEVIRIKKPFSLIKQ